MSCMLVHTAELHDIAAVGSALRSFDLDVELLQHSSGIGGFDGSRCSQLADVCTQWCCFADQVTSWHWQYTEKTCWAKHQPYDPCSWSRESAARRVDLLGRKDTTVMA